MKTKKVYFKKSIGFLLFILLASVVMYTSNVYAQTKTKTLLHTPTFLVPGTNANNNRFDDFIQEIKKAGLKNQSVLKVYVKQNGDVTLNGTLDKNDPAPFIVVGFADNAENDVPKEAIDFQKVLTAVEKYYQFDTYYYIGHSNGGLVITDYLKNARQPEDPTLAKLVTLGTPYDGTENTDAADSMINADILTAQDFDETLDFDMLNIAGNVGEKSDGVVPVSSVMAGENIYADYVDSYDDIIVTDEDASHSDLIDNQDVILQIKNFLFDSK